MKLNKVILLTGFLLICESSTWARLGDRLSNSESTAIRSRAGKVSGSSDIRESTVNGIAIKEYFSSDGVVFAVSWRGVAQPDLTDLLGDYYADYDKAAKEQLPPQRRGKSATIKSEQIVVRKFGHMRDVRGVAYVPALLPAGVKVEELQ